MRAATRPRGRAAVLGLLTCLLLQGCRNDDPPALGADEMVRRAPLVVAALGRPDRLEGWAKEDFENWVCWLDVDWRKSRPVYMGVDPWNTIAFAAIACSESSLRRLEPAVKELFPVTDPQLIETWARLAVESLHDSEVQS